MSKKLRFSALRMAFILSCVLAAGGHPQAMGALDEKTAAARKAKLETLRKEMIPYLKCEPVRRNQFGEADKPDGLFIPELYTVKGLPGSETLWLPLWEGQTAQIEAIGGYGFFAIFQHYPTGSAPFLLSRFKEAGWDMKQITAFDLGGHTTINYPDESKHITVYKGLRADSGMPRTLTLLEAGFNLQAEEKGQNPYTKEGVTVWCSYDKPKK